MTCKDCLHYPVCHALAVNEQAPLVPPHECEHYSNYIDWICCPINNPQGLIEDDIRVGDTVYEIDNSGRIYESKIRNIIFETGGVAFDQTAIGKSIFRSKEEAEEALKEYPRK